GTFGSRQEEAQRLGRILRPKADGRPAHFFTVVARDTNDQEFAARRQRFLAELGYAYEIVDAEAILRSAANGEGATAVAPAAAGGLPAPTIELPPPAAGGGPDEAG
ncbi:MAG: excision repair protein, partial [Actinomycetota bacterium]|nr:excision repair protein [Actinomycetota bacterium]